MPGQEQRRRTRVSFQTLMTLIGPAQTLAGRVARLDRDGLGIEFSEIALDSFMHLHKIVSYNSDDPNRNDREIGQRPVF
jgi:hypothetical protein